MRLIIIGAVAAGTSAAAKARRNDEEMEIVIYEKDQYISYSGCGMPYYLGGEVGSMEELTPRDPAFFKSKYQVEIKNRQEVEKIDPVRKTIQVKNLETGEVYEDVYDKLVLATGARAVLPPIKGRELPHVFTLRNINDMIRIKSYLVEKKPQKAVIVGSGFIGLEVCENLKSLGISVTVIEKLPQVTPGLDPEMATYVKEELEKNQVQVILESGVEEITTEKVVLTEGREVEADFVLLSTGVRPNVDLAVEAGVELGATGAIKVDTDMSTSVEDIYACGDCIETLHLVSNEPVYRPLGSTANKTGRIAGDSLSGGNLRFRGILSTGIFKIFQQTVAMTGLSEREAIRLGFEVQVCHNIKPDKPEYMGGKEMIIKGIACKRTGRLLGVQIVGPAGVDKRIDVFATAITYKAQVEDLFHLDLAYAPTFSTTKDPVMYTGMILDNALHQNRPLMTSNELKTLIESGKEYQLIDARAAEQYQAAHIETAENITQGNLREKQKELKKELPTITYCNKGVTGNAAQNILINHGFKEVYNLSGGHKHFRK